MAAFAGLLCFLAEFCLLILVGEVKENVCLLNKHILLPVNILGRLCSENLAHQDRLHAPESVIHGPLVLKLVALRPKSNFSGRRFWVVDG